MSLYHQLALPSNKTFGHSDDLIPIDLIRFIDDSKAPEVYIQELEELVKKENEQAHGKLGRKGEGIGRFRDKLMQEFQKVNK
jgi:predicted NACHT family NTPase